MNLRYAPRQSIGFDNTTVSFLEPRDGIRSKLDRAYREVSETINLAPGTEPLQVRRDIYTGGDGDRFYFFLNYNTEDLLIEVEVHQCQQLEIGEVVFHFGDQLDAVVGALNKKFASRELSEGEVFFEELNAVLSNEERMGGSGDGIAYFYCAADCTHLL